MDSNAKKSPAIGAPNPALMPAADPAAMSPSLCAVFAEDVMFASSLTPPATDAPISTDGPSGPSDAPLPRVTTAAAALSTGLNARLSGPSGPSASPAPSSSVSSASASSVSNPSTSTTTVSSSSSSGDPARRPRHRGARGTSSPSNPPAANLSPVTRNPAAVGAATALTAWKSVSAAGPDCRSPSSWNRDGSNALKMNTASCVECSATLKSATPRPVARPMAHATRSLPVSSSSK
mmetsp:Transcript_12853/g.35270  ORF Transcript_12853/g.35270 Transcript_12853/m.35270 type:complete len:235 (-) Transcript_12853:355-1059(-)